MVQASSFTEWLSATSTATLGALALLFTVWQWRASGFRPKMSALVDPSRQAIELDVVNQGRATGLIHHVVVIDKDQLAKQFEIEGFPGGIFAPTALPGFAAMKLIIMAPEKSNFDPGDQVKVSWSKKNRFITPLQVDVGLYGLKTVLPPTS